MLLNVGALHHDSSSHGGQGQSIAQAITQQQEVVAVATTLFFVFAWPPRRTVSSLKQPFNNDRFRLVADGMVW